VPASRPEVSLPEFPKMTAYFRTAILTTLIKRQARKGEIAL
jgi:hypothetical protein